MKRTPMNRRYVPTGPRPEVVELVYARANYSCEICDRQVGDRRGIDHHIHHRRPRGAGGTRRPDTNSPQSLLLLCPPCHLHVESNREVAYAMGWLVPQSKDPLTIKVLVRRDAWVLLSPSGRYIELNLSAPEVQHG